MLLKVKGLHKKYGQNGDLALKGLSLSIKKGHIVGLVGESGSGKSTLLAILNGSISAQKGHMIFQGQHVDLTEEVMMKTRPGIRLIAQDYQLPGNISVHAALKKQLRHFDSKWMNQRITYLSSLCALDKFIDKSPETLSGGQQQRAAIALAIAEGPDLLLLDEPFTGLDAALKNEVQKSWMQILKEEQISAILVSHDPTDILMHADEVLAIKHGKKYQIGSALELYKKPKNTYVAGLLGPFNYIDNDIIRPESIKVSKSKEGMRVTIKNAYFQGSRYLNTADYQDEIISFYSKKDLTGKTVNLSW